jgi:hypothetical protein
MYYKIGIGTRKPILVAVAKEKSTPQFATRPKQEAEKMS